METLRVLIVDGEPTMRGNLLRQLRDYRVTLPESELEVGFDVTPCGTMREALALAEDHAPDIVLLEYTLPDRTGMELLEALQELTPRPVAIMVTSFATLDTAIRATKRGAHDFLPKPFTQGELKDAVRRAADHLCLQRRAEQLEAERKQVRFQFIRVLGHELKAPLAAVEGFLNLMQQRVMGPDLAAYDEIIGRCLARTEGMRKLILDLLDLTRIEAGERTRDLTPTDLVPLARNALALIEEQAKQRALKVALDAPAELLIEGDPVELEIILNNLVSNAAKYNRDGGSIRVTLRRTDDAVTIAVSDTGHGMTQADADKLFNDFVRIKNKHTRDIPGSGLGLSTVKKIARLYHGSVAVESEPGAGSTFTVTLPHRRNLHTETNDADARRDPALATRAD
jgi:signal transduction histidine kinase